MREVNLGGLGLPELLVPTHSQHRPKCCFVIRQGFSHGSGTREGCNQEEAMMEWDVEEGGDHILEIR